MFYGKPGSDDAGVLFARKANELHIGNEAGKMDFSTLPAGVSLLRYLDPKSSSECAKLLHHGSARFCFSRNMTIKKLQIRPLK